MSHVKMCVFLVTLLLNQAVFAASDCELYGFGSTPSASLEAQITALAKLNVAIPTVGAAKQAQDLKRAHLINAIRKNLQTLPDRGSPQLVKLYLDKSLDFSERLAALELLQLVDHVQRHELNLLLEEFILLEGRVERDLQRSIAYVGTAKHDVSSDLTDSNAFTLDEMMYWHLASALMRLAPKNETLHNSILGFVQIIAFDEALLYAAVGSEIGHTLVSVSGEEIRLPFGHQILTQNLAEGMYYGGQTFRDRVYELIEDLAYENNVDAQFSTYDTNYPAWVLFTHIVASMLLDEVIQPRLAKWIDKATAYITERVAAHGYTSDAKHMLATFYAIEHTKEALETPYTTTHMQLWRLASDNMQRHLDITHIHEAESAIAALSYAQVDDISQAADADVYLSYLERIADLAFKAEDFVNTHPTWKAIVQQHLIEVINYPNLLERDEGRASTLLRRIADAPMHTEQVRAKARVLLDKIKK